MSTPSGTGRGRGLPFKSPPTASNAPVRKLTIGRGIAVAGSSSAVRESETPSTGIYTTRPTTATDSKAGESGKVVDLSANYFKLVPDRKFQLTLYLVTFEPQVDDLKMRQAFVRQHADVFGGYLFDGDKRLYLTRRLDQEAMGLDVTSREGDTYKLKVIKSGNKITMDDQMANQVLNLILKRAMDGLNMQRVGRNLYDPKSVVQLRDHKVELWPGYITSVRQHEQDILVCCEVSHKVMREQTILEIMMEHRNSRSPNWQESFKREIIGSIVLTDYNNRTYKIDDVDFDSSPQSTFKQWDKDSKSEISVTIADYYKKRYPQLRIKDEKQPMLVAKARFADKRQKEEADNFVLLVPELCRATGLTDKMRANFRMMKDMAAHTQMDPACRTKRLLELTTRLKECPESVDQLRRFNVELGDDLIRFKGRSLDQEDMVFGNKITKNDDKVDWTTPMKMNHMFATVPLKRWMLIYPKKAWNDTEVFLKCMREVAVGLNFEVSDPKLIQLDNDSVASYAQNIREAASKDPKLIVIVVPNNSADRYAAIKKETYVSRAIPSQVIVHKTMQPKKGNMGGVKSIATKVMVQINCKLGGAPWTVKFPIKRVMTIGFDVTHDTLDKRGKSYGAFVASMDICEQILYYSKVMEHKDGTEMSSNIELSMIEALHKFKEAHDSLPDRIFFYRDGVSDSQVEFVHSHEVQRLSKTLDKIYAREDLIPKFTFIVVNKRINTRFFNNIRDSPQNPVSGTIVDGTVTLPERYDFFLISQSVRQGTVLPTSYNVLHDTNGMTPDKVQRLTYKLTHLYYNWSGTIRVPAVVQYAHKLALLVGENIHAVPQDGLNKLLYYL